MVVQHVANHVRFVCVYSYYLLLKWTVLCVTRTYEFFVVYEKVYRRTLSEDEETHYLMIVLMLAL